MAAKRVISRQSGGFTGKKAKRSGEQKGVVAMPSQLPADCSHGIAAKQPN